ncbi:MAG: transporter [Candidatus Eremiobacteraeota bacterium]|nr:transporter [Candidatus Eremiobacteraeota bacterium]MCW5866059.1 transporter [Candidatus Eremiobacteraeota bacterium]
MKASHLALAMLLAAGPRMALADRVVPDEPAPTPPPASEAAGDNPLLEMDIEQLMHMELIQTTVPGAHWHWEDDWMVGYQFMRVQNEGYNVGTQRVSDQNVLRGGNYNNIHTSMTMDMHMLMAMYGPSDDVTLMVMVPYMDMTMNHLTRTGSSFQVKSQGFGDIRVAPIVSLFDEYPHRIQLEAGLSLPTGSVNKKDLTPTGFSQLEYKMQTGSGTVDLQPALTYLGQNEDLNWGAQARGTLRLGTNSAGYRQGNMIELTAWVSPKISDNFSPSLRIDALKWGNVVGRDVRLNPRANPESDPNLQGGEQINLLFGLNFAAGLDDQGRGHRFSIEGGLPIYQNLNGPQIREAWRLGGAWNWTF